MYTVTQWSSVTLIAGVRGWIVFFSITPFIQCIAHGYGHLIASEDCPLPIYTKALRALPGGSMMKFRIGWYITMLSIASYWCKTCKWISYGIPQSRYLEFNPKEGAFLAHSMCRPRPTRSEGRNFDELINIMNVNSTVLLCTRMRVFWYLNTK